MDGGDADKYVVEVEVQELLPVFRANEIFDLCS